LGAANVKYQKPVLTVEQQVELLLSRGMAGDARTTGGCGTGC
jgi:hypothetical protein